MYIRYNPNPKNKRVGDCSVRALCKALDQDWDTTFLCLCVYAMREYDMPSANYIWGEYLKHEGFVMRMIPNACPRCMTVREFCEEHPEGLFVLACDNDHVVTVCDSNFFDTWDSGDSVVLYYYELAKEE